MAENVFRRARKASFTTVYRSVAQDKRISLKAPGAVFADAVSAGGLGIYHLRLGYGGRDW